MYLYLYIYIYIYIYIKFSFYAIIVHDNYKFLSKMTVQSSGTEVAGSI